MYSDDSLSKNKKEKQALLIQNDKCDKYDYLLAVGCGAIGGMIDIFLVGTPKKDGSKLCKWTDAQADNAVKAFAKKVGWSPREGNEGNVSSAIGYLEKKYKVNYDQATSKTAGGALNMWTKDHHMKSLGHAPDVVGLFFSILDQFTATSTFISDGKIITINADTQELIGTNFISKIFCGITNWFGHLMSDFAGSSGSRGNGKRGMGIVLPFYELFGLCEFGSFSDGNGNKQSLAMIATRAFNEGYDARFGLAMAVPVLITDLSIRLIWSIRRFFQMKKPLKECVPTNVHPDLRVMLIVGNGTLCAMDSIDAAVRSGGDFLTFFMRLNMIAWFKLVKMVIKEVCIRVGVSVGLQAQIEAFKRVNEAIALYLQELKQIDIEAYRKEVEKYNAFTLEIEKVTNENEMNKLLVGTYEKLGLKKPWEGDFDNFMSDKSAKLVFE